MHDITVTLKAECLTEAEWLKISSLLKTICHTLDVAIEARSKDNDVNFGIVGAHPDSETNLEPGKHPLNF